MATLASIGINITGDSKELSTALSSASAKMESFAQRAGELGKTLSTRLTLPIVGAGALMVKAFTEQEDAERKLTAAIEAAGGAAETTMTQFKAFAAQMQRTTVVGDEVSLRLLQVATSQGLTADSAMRASKNAIAMQAAFGVGAESAIRMTSALEQGNASMLRRYIPALKDVEDEATAVAMAHEILGRAFNVAEKEAETFGGQMSQLKNNFGDLMQEFGAIIAEGLTPLIAKMGEAVKAFQGMDDQTKRFIVSIAGITAVIGPALYIIPKLTIAVRTLTAAMLANPYIAVATAIVAIGTAAYNALKPVNDLNKAIRDQVGIGDAVTGEQEEQARILQRITELARQRANMERLRQAAINRADQMNAQSYQHQIQTIDRTLEGLQKLYQQSVLFNRETQTTSTRMASVATQSERLVKSIDSIDVNRIPTLGRAIQANINRPLIEVPVKVNQISASMIFAKAMAENFTNSFGAGMANIVVQGERLTDVLKNIGKLLLSSAIQTGIRLLLLGTGGFGVAGGTTGLIGRLFGGAVGAPVAGSALSVDGAFTLQGTDLVLAINRSQRTFS